MVFVKSDHAKAIQIQTDIEVWSGLQSLKSKSFAGPHDESVKFLEVSDKTRTETFQIDRTKER